MTRPYAEVIGDPVSHSKSPLIHNFWLEKLGIDAEYRTCHVKPEELAGYFTQRRKDPDWRGCNVTIPHKEKVAPLIDCVEEGARKIGALNTVWKADDRLYGTNTDVEGVAEAIGDLDPSGRIAVVIGAGGAARSAFAYLERCGCEAVRVITRSPEKARGVVSDFALPVSVHAFDETQAFAGASLLVNATQLGMSGQPEMPGPVLDTLGGMSEGGLVFDMVYSPLRTALLTAAASRGLSAVDGLVMLVGQARTAFTRFFGQVPPRQHDAELRELLTR